MGKIIGMSNLAVERLSNLTNVLFVQGLKGNLICVSQLCEYGLHASFIKNAW